MIIRTEDLKTVCSKILTAADANALSPVTTSLELKTENTFLYMNVTNKEYYARCKLSLDVAEDFHAVIESDLFLKLASLTTTDTIELSVRDNVLIFKGNGTYKIPLIFMGDKLIDLPEIKINNVTTEFDIDGEILNSILQYNSKELNKGVAIKPVQKLYYLDEFGALTFTSSGGCVNSFMLPVPVKLLMQNRIVQLFKLFKNERVHFTLGYDAITDDIIQTKACFESDDTMITAILSCDDTLLRSVPVEAIRGRANTEYPYAVTINRDACLQAIKRLMLFTPENTINLYSDFIFKKDCVIIHDVKRDNKEEIYYTGNSINDEYTATLDFMDLKLTLETCSEPYVTLYFGNEVAVVIARGNIKNIISETHFMG